MTQAITPSPVDSAKRRLDGKRFRGSRDAAAIRAEAEAILSYRNGGTRPFVHLLDGGLSDNLGARVPYRALVGKSSFNFDNVRNSKSTAPHHFVFITVNARTRHSSSLDERDRTPRVFGVLSATTSPMDNYTDETLARMEERIQAMETERPGQDHRYYWIHLTFDSISDPKEQRWFHELPTSFSLPNRTSDLLRDIGGRLLRESPEYQRLIAALNPPLSAMEGKIRP